MEPSDDLAEYDIHRAWHGKQTADFQAFANSTRCDELESRYWNAPQATYESIDCLWDRRSAATQFNWECADDKCLLYEGPSDLIWQRFHQPTALMIPRVYRDDVVDKHRFLWVIDHWLSGYSLTPPCLVFRPNGKLGVRDGFHRLAVAAIVGAKRMPFWGVGPSNIPGITLSDPDGSSS